MYQKEKAVCHATQAELEQVKRENETLKGCITKLARGGLTWNG